MANPEDIPGISKLLSDWRLEESKFKEKLNRIRDDQGPSPEALRIIEQLDDLIERLSEADREKIAYAMNQTVKRITLRCERRNAKSFRITMWDGMIELRDDLGVDGFIPLADDDIPAPGRWREVADYIRQRGDVVFFKDACEHLNQKGSSVSKLLAQCVLSGKVKNLGHQKGWIATTN